MAGDVVHEDAGLSGVAKYLGVPVMYIISLGTIVGNLLVLCAILSTDLRKSKAKRFLLNLAVADMCVGLFVMLPAIHKFELQRWDMGWQLCLLWVTLDVAFSTASIYSLLGVSVDRFYALYYPIKYYNQRADTMQTNLLMGMAWVMALVVSMPMYIVADGFSTWVPSVKNNSATDCIPPVEPSSTGFVMYAAHLAFIIPFTLLIVLIAAFTLRIRQRLENKIEKAKEDEKFQIGNDAPSRGDSKSMNLDAAKFSRTQETSSVVEPFEGKDSEDLVRTESKFVNRAKSRASARPRTPRLKKAIAQQRKITIMMAIIMLTFLICWTPFVVMFTSFPFMPEYWSPITIDVFTWIGYLNSMLNPCIYPIMNLDIRAAMISVIKLKKLRAYLAKK